MIYFFIQWIYSNHFCTVFYTTTNKYLSFQYCKEWSLPRNPKTFFWFGEIDIILFNIIMENGIIRGRKMLQYWPTVRTVNIKIFLDNILYVSINKWLQKNNCDNHIDEKNYRWGNIDTSKCLWIENGKFLQYWTVNIIFFKVLNFLSMFDVYILNWIEYWIENSIFFLIVIFEFIFIYTVHYWLK